jgi:hypothetical protein
MSAKMKIISSESLRLYLSKLSVALSECEGFTKRATLILLAAQALLCVGAVLSRVMLYGDGSFFVYAIAAGDPWGLIWSSFVTRASIYVLTVVPVAFVSGILDLTGEQIAAVNGLTFYGLQWLQYLVVVWMAWRRFPHLLVFPVAQYGLSLGLGFGFPSEILLSPGFFWICLFSLMYRPVPWILLITAFAGLVFSHEFAFAGVILILAFAWLKYRTSDAAQRLSLPQFATLAAISGAILIVWFFIRMSGGGVGGDYNGIYVFDPRRILNDPTLWLITLAVIALCASPLVKLEPSWRALGAIGFSSVVLTVASSFVFNFAQGRYDSARTLIGFCIVILGSIFIAQQTRWVQDKTDRPPLVLVPTLKKCIVAVLAINLSASAIFLWEWDAARRDFAYVVNGNPDPQKVEIVPYDDARVLLSPEAAQYIDRMDFSWTWPFRSIVLARDFHPGRVIVDLDTMYDLCHSHELEGGKASRIPADVTDTLLRFACMQPTAPDRRYFRQWLRSLFKRL